MEAWSIHDLSRSIFQIGINDFLLLVYHAKKKAQWGKILIQALKEDRVYIYTP